MLLRIESVRVQTEYTRARLALTGYLPEGEARRSAAKLEKDHKNPLAGVWSLIVRAALDVPRAAALYEQALALAEQGGLRATAASLRLRIGELRGDAALVSAGEGELASLGVRNAKRMTALLAPMRR